MPDQDEAVGKARGLIKKIEAARQSTVLVMVSPRELDDRTAFELNNILRSAGQVDRLDVLLESGGGDIDMAYKMLTLLKAYSRQVRVVVPFFAKSAATIIALGADRLALCKAGELGPVDPQVEDPQTGEFVPARSVKKTIDFIAEITDSLTRITLAEKIPVMLIGAYRTTEMSSRQYLDEILDKKGLDEDKKAELLDAFTKEFSSHGYPMGREFLAERGIPLDDIDEPTEALFVDLHAAWQKYLHSIPKYQAWNALILQTKKAEFVHMPHVHDELADEPKSDAGNAAQLGKIQPPGRAAAPP